MAYNLRITTNKNSPLGLFLFYKLTVYISVKSVTSSPVSVVVQSAIAVS